jgi:hypothetical protein
MLFLALYDIPMETLRECQERFMTEQEDWTGVKLVGRWHHVQGNTGALIIESEDARAIGAWANQWTDLLSMEISPVYDDEGIRAVLSD